MEKDFEETMMIHVQDDDGDEMNERIVFEQSTPEDPNKNKKKKPKKKKKKLTKAGRRVFQVILVVAIIVAAYSGWRIYSGLKQYDEGDTTYDELAKTMVVTDSSEGVDNYATKLAELEKLRDQNEDFVAWLKLDNTLINYPVVRGDDNVFYLRHLFTKEYNFMGCVFIDYRNAADFSDANTAFYSHHMYNGSMFCDLVKYKDQEFYDTHKEWNLDTFSGPFKIEPYAAIYTTGDADIIQFNFENDEDFMNYIHKFDQDSTFKSDVTVKPGDQLVTFVTCDNYVNNGRFAMISKLSKIEE